MRFRLIRFYAIPFDSIRSMRMPCVLVVCLVFLPLSTRVWRWRGHEHGCGQMDDDDVFVTERGGTRGGVVRGGFRGGGRRRSIIVRACGGGGGAAPPALPPSHVELQRVCPELLAAGERVGEAEDKKQGHEYRHGYQETEFERTRSIRNTHRIDLRSHTEASFSPTHGSLCLVSGF